MKKSGIIIWGLLNDKHQFLVDQSAVYYLFSSNQGYIILDFNKNPYNIRLALGTVSKIALVYFYVYINIFAVGVIRMEE